MMTDKQLIERLLELQEHPEQVTEEQLQHMLNNEQMHELVEQMAFTKRAFKSEESQPEDYSVEDEWEKFAASHADELVAFNEDKAQPHSSLFTFHSFLHKIAASLTFGRACSRLEEQMQASLPSRLVASFIGILLISGIAIAAIHIVHQKVREELKSPTREVRMSDSPQRATPADTINADTRIVEPRIFNNVPLDSMLIEIADYYHVSVEFEREEARLLRFHFVWKRTDSLDRLVEKLNNFEALNIIREREILIVK